MKVKMKRQRQRRARRFSWRISDLKRRIDRRRKKNDREKAAMRDSDKPPFLCGNRELNV